MPAIVSLSNSKRHRDKYQARKELEEKLSEIETHASELQQKQEELADVRLNQDVALADLRLSLNQEESKKSDLEAEKAAAKKKREETLKQLAAEKR